MTEKRTERIIFRCTKEEKQRLQERANQCAIKISSYCREVSLGGRPRAAFTQEEKALMIEMAKLKGSLTRMANFFSKGQYADLADENRALLNELKKIIRP